MSNHSLFRTIVQDMAFSAKKLNVKEKKLSIKTIFLMLISPEFRVVMSYRINSYLYRAGFERLSTVLYCFSKKKYSTDMHPKATIGVPFKVGHHMGIVIGPEVTIGNSCYFLNNVTFGNASVGGQDVMPTVGDEVIVGVGARILGGVSIGNGSIIGANSVVRSDIPAGEVWAGIPAKKIRCKL
ncbi:serine O-acetyltransferase [Vibrio sp. 10N.261.51.F12]|uniref:serine O-acetyltransferase n=1 Tax=Vibrio sp. 10N.261.51.F12 TaxID=3229679 RepID=UPI0035537B20